MYWKNKENEMTKYGYLETGNVDRMWMKMEH